MFGKFHLDRIKKTEFTHTMPMSSISIVSKCEVGKVHYSKTQQ